LLETVIGYSYGEIAALRFTSVHINGPSGHAGIY